MEKHAPWIRRAVSFAASLLDLARGFYDALTQPHTGFLMVDHWVEIVELRGSRTKTRRQQASQIDAKAGIKGRSQLSAFFLQDLIGDPGKAGAASSE